MKVDMHVHSCHSEEPSEWLLRRIGTKESYTTVDAVYASARSEGMNFVTITDHNRIDGIMNLVEKHPDVAFTGVESTAVFPEDGCRVHVLCYGFTESQFREIDRVRSDVYVLRDYLQEQGIAHAVAHATFAVNGKLTVNHIGRLLLMFDCFEAINGTRSTRANLAFFETLRSLSPEIIGDLRRRYRIEPSTKSPWVKGLIAGSDDHCGLRIGKTWTETEAVSTPAMFLEKMINRRTIPCGEHSNYRIFAFSIYKIACDFSREKATQTPPGWISVINDMLFGCRITGWKRRFAIKHLRISSGNMIKEKGMLLRMVSGMVAEMEKIKDVPIDEKIDLIYDKIGATCDELTVRFMGSLRQAIAKGDLASIFNAFQSVLPCAFMTIPFFSSLRLATGATPLQNKIDHEISLRSSTGKKRILWFTDTIVDQNGPSETIRKMSWLGLRHDLELIPAVCRVSENRPELLPPGTIEFPYVGSFTLSVYSMVTIAVPSVLASIKMICDAAPDEIIVSTPGPVGLLGILAARLLNIPCQGIFHTDFTGQAACLTDDDTVTRLIEEYLKWFYGMCYKIKVPTRRYISILSDRGYPMEKMSLFCRGIDSDLFAPDIDARTKLEKEYGIPSNRVNLLCVGRMSADKSVSMAARIHEELLMRNAQVNLIFAGSGPEPWYTEFKNAALSTENVFFLGRLPRVQLPVVYAGSDLLLFPSATDTFGMAVLEAQACGVPALVSDSGGPQEIVLNTVTGYVLPSGNTDAWVRTIVSLITMMTTVPEQFIEMKHRARDHVVRNFSWVTALNDLVGLAHPGNHDDEQREEYGSSFLPHNDRPIEPAMAN